jgi:hypothetical protein
LSVAVSSLAGIVYPARPVALIHQGAAVQLRSFVARVYVTPITAGHHYWPLSPVPPEVSFLWNGTLEQWRGEWVHGVDYGYTQTEWITVDLGRLVNYWGQIAELVRWVENYKASNPLTFHVPPFEVFNPNPPHESYGTRELDVIFEAWI